MEDLPGNSHHRRQPEPRKEAPKKIEQVVSGEVVRRKKPVGKRFREFFIGGDAKESWHDAIVDVVVPSTKDTIADTLQQVVEGILFGGQRRGRPNIRPGSGGFTNYQLASRSNSSIRQGSPNDFRPQRSHRSSRDIDDIIIPTRHEANEVLQQLYYLMEKYQQVTVADVYELVGIDTTYTDNKWGWLDIREVGISRVRSGYLLNLPRPESIE